MLRKASVGLVLVLAACGSAKVISRTQTGGIIELQGDRAKAMEQANSEMSAHCGPNNFSITQEGEEAVGTDTFTREDTAQDSKTSRSGRKSSSDSTTVGQTSTRTATAWRVHYQCAGAAVAGPPPEAPAPPPEPAPAPPPPAPATPPPPPVVAPPPVAQGPTAPPPAPREERYERRDGFVWARGHYEWRGNSYEWVAGHWERQRARSDLVRRQVGAARQRLGLRPGRLALRRVIR